MWVTVPNEGVSIASYLAVPSGPGPFPGVLVLQEIFGVNAHVRETAERLAKEGFLALAPALFQRTAPGLDIGYEAGDVLLGRSHKDKTAAAQLLSDLGAGLAYLSRRPDCKKDRFGAIGFCFGGHVAFLAATLPPIAATASFYGAGIATMTPGGGPPSLSRAREIRGEIALFFGENDPLIPKEQTDLIERELQRAGVTHAVHRYPAGHGFFCNHRADYDAPSARHAWDETIALFRRRLG
jgi:carboxymethylenebutenolidase